MFLWFRHWPLFCWVVVLVVLAAVGLHQLPDPQDRRLFADQATHIMAAQSIWHDFDLKYTLEDLARFRATVPAEPGPVNVFLKLSDEDQIYFAKPFLYAFFSAPFVALLGLNGFLLFNVLCLGLIGIIALKILENHFSQRVAFLLTVGFLLFSPFLAWTPIAHPDIFIAFLLLVGGFLLVHREGTTAFRLLGALLLGLVIYEKITFALIVAPLVLTLAGIVKKPVILYLSIVIFMGWAIPSAVGWLQDGNVLAYKGLRFVVQDRIPGHFPLEAGWDRASLKIGVTDAVFKLDALAQAIVQNLSLLPSKLADFLIGRQTGILLYFPVTLFLLIYLMGRPTWRGAFIVSGFFAYLILQWLIFPTNGYGGSQTYGPRYTMQASVALLLAVMASGKISEAKRTLPTSWRLMVLSALILSVVMQYQVIPPTLNPVGYPSLFLLAPKASLFPLETPLLPVIAPMLPPSFHEKAKGNFVFRIDGNPANCFANTITKDGQAHDVILYQLGRPHLFSPLRVDATHKMRIELLVGDHHLATTVAQPGTLSYLQVENLLAETHHCRLMGDVRWQRVTVRARLDSSEPPTTPPLIRLGLLDAATANDCWNQGFHRPKLYGHAPFNQPSLPDFIDEVIGLYDNEPWGRWSIDDRVLFRFTQPLPEHFTLVIVMHAYRPNIGAPITVTAGAAQATFTAQAYPQTHALTFKLTAPTDTLVFTVPEPVRPRDLGIGMDERRLGLGFGSLKIFHTD